MKKFVRYVSANEIILGRVYDDGSRGEFIRLETNARNEFEIKFVVHSDIAYKFLPECAELMDVLKQGIVGMSMADMAVRLHSAGYDLISPAMSGD